MLAVAPMQWAELKDVDDVEPRGPEDDACIAELYAVLKKHGKVDKFGINLLHRHFEVADDEILLEETDVGQRMMIIRTVPKSGRSVRALETNWRLVSHNDAQVMTACTRECTVDGNNNHTSHGHNKS